MLLAQNYLAMERHDIHVCPVELHSLARSRSRCDILVFPVIGPSTCRRHVSLPEYCSRVIKNYLADLSGNNVGHDDKSIKLRMKNYDV